MPSNPYQDDDSLSVESHSVPAIEPVGPHRDLRAHLRQLDQEYLVKTWQTDDGTVVSTVGFRAKRNEAHFGVFVPPVIYQIATAVGLVTLQSRVRDTHEPDPQQTLLIASEFFAHDAPFPEEFDAPWMGTEDPTVERV